MLEPGILYVCATPIGNLKDITLRVLDTLKKVDLIAAEDTRHTRKLLSHYDIRKPLTSYHEHNEKQRAEELLERLRSGNHIALVSDAGMPGISDPGQHLIQRCYQEGISVDVLPGANAALTALVLSGIGADRFLFYGFLPASKSERNKVLESLVSQKVTLIFYEAPHRLLTVLQSMKEIIGNRNGAVVRELTKMHQSVHRGSLEKLISEFQEKEPRGECCVLIEPPEEETLDQGNPSEWLRELAELEEEGMESKEAMKMVAKKYGISKREVYRAKIERKQ